MILEEYRSNRNRQEARLDVKDNEARELSAIRIQRAKMNVGNEQVLFLAQVQELKDSQNDARTEKHLKLKNSLQEGKLDAAHQRSMEFVAQKSNSTMAMAGLQPLPPPPSFSATFCVIRGGPILLPNIRANQHCRSSNGKSRRTLQLLTEQGVMPGT